MGEYDEGVGDRVEDAVLVGDVVHLLGFDEFRLLHDFYT